MNSRKHERISGRNWKDLKRELDSEVKMPSLEIDRGPVDKATEIYESMKKKRARGKNSLYVQSATQAIEFTDTNALIGVLAAVLGEHDDAEELYNLLAQKARNNDGTFRCTPESYGNNLAATAAVGILAAALGKHEDVSLINELIEKQTIETASNGKSLWRFKNPVDTTSISTIGTFFLAAGDVMNAKLVHGLIEHRVLRGPDGIFGQTGGIRKSGLNPRVGLLLAGWGEIEDMKAIYELLKANYSDDALDAEPVVGIMNAVIGGLKIWE